MPDLRLQIRNDLATEIFYFLMLQSGKLYNNISSTVPMDGWSQLVWDLLKMGLLKAFNRRRSGRSGVPRHAGGPVYLSDGLFFASFTDGSALTTAKTILGDDYGELFTHSQEVPPDDVSQRGDKDDHPGVSIVLLETSELRGG
jgi:hypothetical protein